MDLLAFRANIIQKKIINISPVSALLFGSLLYGHNASVSIRQLFVSSDLVLTQDVVI